MSPRLKMAGKYSAVRKAVLSVSSCLQEPGNFGNNNRRLGMVPHGYDHRMGREEEVVFRLLCQADKVGSLIDKGGSYKRALQAETGASVKIADPTLELEERVVVVSVREEDGACQISLANQIKVLRLLCAKFSLKRKQKEKAAGCSGTGPELDRSMFAAVYEQR